MLNLRQKISALKSTLTEQSNPLDLSQGCQSHIHHGIGEHINLVRQKFFADALFFLHCNNFFGNYFEFGTYQAWTFRQVMLWAKRLGMNNMLFYGFDSFEGFPKIKENDYSGAFGGFKDEAGTRAMSEDDFYSLIKHSAPDMIERVKTFKGFYDKTLNEETARKITGRASLVNVDCDLYESAVPVFKFIENFIEQGSVIYIDDYWVGYKGSPDEGVAKAFKEYKVASRFDFADWGRVGGWGHAFVAQAR